MKPIHKLQTSSLPSSPQHTFVTYQLITSRAHTHPHPASSPTYQHQHITTHTVSARSHAHIIQPYHSRTHARSHTLIIVNTCFSHIPQAQSPSHISLTHTNQPETHQHVAHTAHRSSHVTTHTQFNNHTPYPSPLQNHSRHSHILLTPPTQHHHHCTPHIPQIPHLPTTHYYIPHTYHSTTQLHNCNHTPRPILHPLPHTKKTQPQLTPITAI